MSVEKGMHLPLNKTFVTETGGSMTKVVECEHCRKRYAYHVVRRARGEGNSLFHMDDQGAQRRAVEDAHQRLLETLTKAIEIIPCPSCGWIQSEMQAIARKSHLHRVRVFGWILLGGLVIPLLMLLTTLTRLNDGTFPQRMFIELLVWTSAQFLAGAAILVSCSIACECYDPNAMDLEERLRQGRLHVVMVERPPTSQREV